MDYNGKKIHESQEPATVKRVRRMLRSEQVQLVVHHKELGQSRITDDDLDTIKGIIHGKKSRVR